MSGSAPILWRYAMLGLPLGFLGMPLYMHLPHLYANAFGMSLGALGGVLLLSRLVDCMADPWLGRLLDRPRTAWLRGLALGMVSVGMLGLFCWPVWLSQPPAFWLLGALLIVTYLGYSLLTIRWYARGVGLADTPTEAARVSSWREGALILGVILAAVAPSFGMPYPALAGVCVLLLGVACFVGRSVPQSLPHRLPASGSMARLLARHGHVYLLLFFNALAPAFTATLYLFYMEEVLGEGAQAGLCLLLYFVAALLAMPFWVRCAARWGKIACLKASMLLAMLSFVGASQLGAGDIGAFLGICLVTGVAFGADAALLPSLLSDRLQQADEEPHAAFGIWMGISKLTLALAAGLALPAVGWLEGAGSARGHAIAMLYSLVPCLLKLVAFFCLLTYQSRDHRSCL